MPSATHRCQPQTRQTTTRHPTPRHPTPRQLPLPGDETHTPSGTLASSPFRPWGIASIAGAALLKAPIYLYRFTLRPWLGWPCRHLPTCSDFALEAIDKNGPWRGGWQILARLLRCQPFGTHGYDPVPDIRTRSHVLTPWSYGRWK
ncbi:MAG: membrane protein insertion efficiency factor YidD [Pseudomonadota bacterium]